MVPSLKLLFYSQFFSLTRTVLFGCFMKSFKTKLKHLFSTSHRCAGFYYKNGLYMNRYKAFCGSENLWSLAHYCALKIKLIINKYNSIRSFLHKYYSKCKQDSRFYKQSIPKWTPTNISWFSKERQRLRAAMHHRIINSEERHVCEGRLVLCITHPYINLETIKPSGFADGFV